MADKKIADLNEATTLADTDIVIVEDNANTKKMTWANLKTAIIGAFSSILGNRTYTEQNVVTSGESITKSIDELDIDLASHKAENANLAHGGFRGALVAKATDQSIATGTNTTLSWGDTIYDTANVVDINNNGFLIPQNVSKVRVGLQLDFSVNSIGALGSTGRIEVVVQINGGTTAGTLYQRYDQYNYFRRKNFGYSAVMDVSEGDLITVLLRQDRGESIDVTNSFITWFSLEVIE